MFHRLIWGSKAIHSSDHSYIGWIRHKWLCFVHCFDLNQEKQRKTNVPRLQKGKKVLKLQMIKKFAIHFIYIWAAKKYKSINIHKSMYNNP